MLQILCAGLATGRASWIWGGKLFIVNYLCHSQLHTEAYRQEEKKNKKTESRGEKRKRNEEGKHPAMIIDCFSVQWEHCSYHLCYRCLQFEASLFKERGK